MTSYGSTLEAPNGVEFYHQENDGDQTVRSNYNEQNGHEPRSMSKSPQPNGFMTYRDKEDNKPDNINHSYRPNQNTHRSDNKGENNYQDPALIGHKNQGLSLEYGKTIRLLRNGDEFYRGHKFVINSRKYRYFDVFMDDISNDLNANFGAIRKIHTPVNGHRIRSLDELEDGKTYVASGNSRFVKINYADVLEGKRIAPNNRLPSIPRTDYSNFVVPQYDTPQNALIYIYRNGDIKTPPAKILLYKTTMNSYDAVLDQISNKIKLPSGPVFKLFTLDGEMCQGSADILSGNSYVAANKERFKKVDYLSVGDGSPRGYVRKTRILNRISNDVIDISSEKQSAPRNLWLDFSRKRNSQPSYTSTSSSNTNSSYGHGQKYNGWRKENTNPNNLPSNLPPVRVQKGRVTVNVDKDESGFFKAKSNYNIKAKKQDAVEEVRDSIDMFIDMPIDKRTAREVDDDEIMTEREMAPLSQKPPVNPNSKNHQQKPPSPKSKQASPPPFQAKIRSPSPVKVKVRSPSPVKVKVRSPSPVKAKVRSPSPKKQASPDILEHRNNRDMVVASVSEKAMKVDYDHDSPETTNRGNHIETPTSNMDSIARNMDRAVRKIDTAREKSPETTGGPTPHKEFPKHDDQKETPRDDPSQNDAKKANVSSNDVTEKTKINSARDKSVEEQNFKPDFSDAVRVLVAEDVRGDEADNDNKNEKVSSNQESKVSEQVA